MKRWYIPVAGVLVIIIVAYLSYRNNPYRVLSGFAQGTTYRIIYKPDFSIRYILNKRAYLFQGEIDSILARFDESLSIYHPTSIISRINDNEPSVIVDDLFKTVFTKAAEISSLTNGAFDITVGPLVNAWGFGPKPGITVDSTRIDSLLQYIGMDKVRIVNDRVEKSIDGIQLDVNAIAQGYSVDLVSMFLENKGIHDYLVEIGGELGTSGRKLNRELWKVGVDKPVDNNLIPGQNIQVIIALTDRSLATSGNYRKFYEENGVKYAHSIDPKTGYPVQHRLLSATVLAEDCITADAFATAFMVLGYEKSINLVKDLQGLDVYFIRSGDDGEFETYLTPGFRKLIIEE